jgi:hypothetical protein
VAPFLLVAASTWATYLEGWSGSSGTTDAFSYTLVQRDRIYALLTLVVGLLVSLRLAWLWLAARSCGNRAATREQRSTLKSAAVTLTAAVAAFVGMLSIYAAWDHRAPSLWLHIPALTNQQTTHLVRRAERLRGV